MKRLHYSVPNNLDLLHDELVAAIPSLAPTRNANGLGTPVMVVQGAAGNVWLTVPDDADEPAISAVVNAHDPAALQPDPRKARLNRIAELLAIARSDWTTAQMRELIQLTAQEVSP